MNVGELRRALEDVSDTREVCFFDEAWYRSASSATTKRMISTEDAGRTLGDYVEADESHPEYKTKLMFVIE